MNARYLRQLARETEYRHAAMHGYVRADRRETLALRWLMVACATISGVGIGTLFLV